MDPHWLVTERLALRRFTPDDLDWAVALYGDEEVTRYLGGLKDRTAVEAWLDERVLRYYDAHPGLGVWLTVERATGERVGFHLLNHIRGESIVQVGFALLKPFWGIGYGTEMALPLLRYGFTERRLPWIAGMANMENVASQHVLLKIGLERKGERVFAHPDYGGRTMAWFERDAAAWLRAHSARVSAGESD